MTSPASASSARRSALLALVLALVSAGLWAWLAPAELSLGGRIRLVYLHVSATWAGLLFLYGTAVAGLVGITGRGTGVEPWLRRTWSAGIALFTLGFVLSLVAAKVSWGGVFWGEPRVRASLGAVGIGVVAVAIQPALASSRVRGVVWAVGAILMTVVLSTSARVLHPDDPIQDVTPWGIKLTFYGLTVLMLGIGALLVAALRSDVSPTGGPDRS